MDKRFRKPLVALAAMVLASSMTLAGCGGAASSTSTVLSDTGTTFSAKSATVNDTDADGVLTVGFDQEFPPYGYVASDGSFTGFDLELAYEVAMRNGWSFKAVPINWDSKDLELSSGTIDCIWNGFTIEGREDGYSWTDAYMDNTQVVVVKSDSGIKSFSDLAGKTVEAQKDSAAYNLLSEGGDQADLAATFKRLTTVADYNTAFMDLSQGACDAIAVDEPVAKFQTSGKSEYTILSEPLTTEHYGVGFLLGNDAETAQVEATLKQMDKDGFIKDLCAKYADQGVSYDNWCL